MQEQLSIAQIARLLMDILPVLQRLHDRGLLHGDITPDHLNWEPGESIYRLAPNVSDSVANPVYSAPEQLRDQPCAASDLYSLGVSCIHLLTGVHPFELLDFGDKSWVWRDYWLAEPGDNLRIGMAIDRLIQPELEHRYGTTEEAIEQLTKITGLTNSSPPNLWSCSKTLSGHSGVFAAITSLALSPQRLASASEDKTIRLWDLATGQTIFVLSGHQGFVESVAFQPEGNRIIASGSRDKTIKIWDNDKVLWTLTGHSQAVNTLAFSPDGQQLASGSSDRTLKLWNITTGELLTTLTGHRLKITTVSYSPMGILAGASADGSIGIWQNGSLQRQLTGHVGAVTAIAFSPNNQLLASGGEDRSIRLWDTETWTCQRILSGHPWLVSALAFMPDSDILLSGSWDRSVKLWQVATGHNFETLTGHDDSVTCLAISNDSQQIFTGGRDRQIKQWSPQL
jgi:WD40 repeat protein